MEAWQRRRGMDWNGMCHLGGLVVAFRARLRRVQSGMFRSPGWLVDTPQSPA
jgi:hypothetical protein